MSLKALASWQFRVVVAALALTPIACGGDIEEQAGDEQAADEQAAGEQAVTISQELNPADPVDPEDEPTTPPPPSSDEFLTYKIEGLSTELYMDEVDVVETTGLWAQQVYGSIAMLNVTANVGTVRNLGKWANPDGLSAAPWNSTDGFAPKTFNTGFSAQNYLTAPHTLFKDTKLCTSSTYAFCSGAPSYNNNAMSVRAKVGDKIRISFDFRDYDAGSGDELFCKGSAEAIVERSTSTGKLTLPYRKYIKGYGVLFALGDNVRDCFVWTRQ